MKPTGTTHKERKPIIDTKRMLMMQRLAICSKFADNERRVKCLHEDHYITVVQPKTKPNVVPLTCHDEDLGRPATS